MKISYLLILLAFFMVMGTSIAPAQTGLRETLTEINRIKPLQQPGLDRAQEILNRKVVGRKNKVLGVVQDVILNNNGNIASLQVAFDRLKLRHPVYLNYNSINAEPVTNGYMLGFESAEIEEMYPSLLSNIETASGASDNTYSLKGLLGAEVRRDDGQRIGKITDVLFGARGDRAEVLYITLDSSTGKARNKSLAVPFNLPTIGRDGAVLKTSVSREQADAIQQFAAGLK